MRLVRYGSPGREKPGLIDEQGRLRDLSGHLGDVTPEALSRERLRQLAGLRAADLPAVDGAPRLGAPVTGVGKIVGVGLNYSDHAAESGLQVPPEPVLFMKATSAISGPNDRVVLPRGSVKSDWEVELGVVIGTRAKYVTEQDALAHVAGYLIVNDLSERAFQIERHGQWDKGKCADTFAPIGPWLVTTDEVPDPQALHMWLEVDGRRFQDGTTATMVYKVPFLVSYISQFMSLNPGDIITTGTPPGVGMGQKPTPIYLKPGNVMRLGIEGLGEQRQEVVADTE